MPELPPSQRCTHCGHAVRWVHSRGGRRFPIDANPRPDGRVVLVFEERCIGEVRRPYRAQALRNRGHELYRFHRCP